MATTTRKIGGFESRIPMVRFSLGEDDEDVPIANKRQRFSQTTFSQSQPQPQPSWVQRSESVVVAVEDDEFDDVEEEEDEESDSQGFEEEEEDEFDDVAEEEEVELESDDDDVAVSDDRNRQQRHVTSSSTAASSHLGLGLGFGNVAGEFSPVFNNATERLQVVLTDPDVLDCPICLEPLITPVFQCENGHIACSTCCTKIKRKCPSCCMPIGYNRCRAIEKVIESIRISCKNSRYGCKETMLYNKRNEHEQSCPHTICYCPHPTCTFADSSKSLYLHFGIKHSRITTRFTYNTAFTLRVETGQKHVFLQEQEESVVFILNHEVLERAHAFNVDCVGTSALKSAFVYRLSAKSMETTVSLESVPEMYANWSEHKPRRNYLTVPSEFCGSGGIVCLNVCIKKSASAT